MKSKGKFIAFLDADDLWQKNKIKDQLNYMRLNESEVSHTSYKEFNVRKKMVIHKARYFSGINDLLPSCDIGLSTVMIDRKVFSKIVDLPILKQRRTLFFG